MSPEQQAGGGLRVLQRALTQVLTRLQECGVLPPHLLPQIDQVSTPRHFRVIGRV